VQQVVVVVPQRAGQQLGMVAGRRHRLGGLAHRRRPAWEDRVERPVEHRAVRAVLDHGRPQRRAHLGPACEVDLTGGADRVEHLARRDGEPVRS
jgi:hypothetical protein